METEAKPDAKKADGPSEQVTVKLRVPIPFGKEQMIEELTLKPVSRAFKDFSLPVSEGKLDYQPYALAMVGLKMSGHVAGAAQILDKMDPKDMRDVANAVFAFFG